MNFAEYQVGTKRTAIYPGAGDITSLEGLTYTVMGLAGEAGELSNRAKKILRDEDGLIGDAVRARLADELGDCLYYVSQLAVQLGVRLEDVATQNLAKLSDRASRGVLKGSRDNR